MSPLDLNLVASEQEQYEIEAAVRGEFRRGGEPVRVYFEADAGKRLPFERGRDLTNAVFAHLEERIVALEYALERTGILAGLETWGVADPKGETP